MRPLMFFAAAAIVATTLPLCVGQNTPSSEISVFDPGLGWLLYDKPLTRGQRLSAIFEVTGRKADSADLVLNCGKDGLLWYSCKEPHCRVPVCSTEENNKAFTVLAPSRSLKPMPPKDAANSYLKRLPEPQVVLRVKAGGSLSDAVVHMTGSSVHWGPVFNRVFEGTYCLHLAALPVTGGTTWRSITIDWDRNVDSEGIVPVPGLQPGLYAAGKGSPNTSGQCVLDPDLPPAWVLVVADANFDSVERDWKEATAQLGQLADTVASPSTIDTFRRVVLSYLADSPQAKQQH